jgi:two-component system, OmpR family, phosphate regulon sensor histidine kinase PhoR
MHGLVAVTKGNAPSDAARMPARPLTWSMTAKAKPHRTSEFQSTLLAIAGRDLRHPLQVIQCTHEYLGRGVRKTSDLHKLRSGRGAIDQFRDQLDELVAALQLHVYIRGGKITFASGGQ